MNESDIRKYAQLMGELGLTGLEIKEQDRVVRLERSYAAAPAPIPVAAPTEAPAQPAADTTAVCSPMVGVFYQAPAENAAPYVKVGGKVLAMKGTAAKEELAEAANAIKKLGLKIEEVKEFPIDGTNHAVIVLRKVAPTPKQYPRRFAKIKQAPL